MLLRRKENNSPSFGGHSFGDWCCQRIWVLPSDGGAQILFLQKRVVTQQKKATDAATALRSFGGAKEFVLRRTEGRSVLRSAFCVLRSSFKEFGRTNSFPAYCVPTKRLCVPILRKLRCAALSLPSDKKRCVSITSAPKEDFFLIKPPLACFFRNFSIN